MAGDKGQGQRRRYIVWWYGYEPEEDLLEAARSIPKHLFTKYNVEVNQKWVSARMIVE